MAEESAENEDAKDEGLFKVMSRKTCMIFFVFCLGVQIFMAYNAGATTGSVDIIQKQDHWSEGDLGLLGGMDKFGMTISSPFWGYMLQFYEARILVTAGLFVNACFTLIFATNRNHGFMLIAKFMMGLSEGLQWVWSQIWVVSKAGGYPLFLNLNGVSAGAGTVVGTAVSGFSTARGMSYGFAFQVEGGVLLCLFVALVLFTRTKDVTVKEDEGEIKRSASGSVLSATPTERKPLKQVLGMLLRHKVYMCTAFVFAFDNFVVLGIQFLWKRLFESVWKVSKDSATTSLIFVPVIGSALGAAVGSAWSFRTPEQVKSTLKKCTWAAFAAVVAAGAGWFGIFYQIYFPPPEGSWISYATLGLAYVGFSLVSAGLTAEMGAIVGICTDCITDSRDRSVSVGLQQGIMNFFGLTLAPVVPQMVMQLAAAPLHIKEEGETAEGEDHPVLILAGISATLLGTVLIFYLCFSAYRAAPGAAPDPSTNSSKQPLLEEKSTEEEPQGWFASFQSWINYFVSFVW